MLPPMPWDESHDGGGPRPAWRGLMRHLEQLGAEDLRARWERGRRLLRESGPAESGGEGRPWALDPIPFVLAPEDWERLERGVVQRAAALDALLTDAYGPQRLLRDGLLPPAAILANPQYLRPCRGWMPAGQQRLTLYACELARGEDGHWQVVADLAQAPPGLGLAVEHRVVLSRLLPEAFRDLRVQRLAPFFARLRQVLAGLAPRHKDNPRIVLLTPGTASASYAEQAYLARYLGYTLAQGDDLTVRDDRVFLKTLGGLHPVDVVLRRVADDWCDPLELRNDSLLGVLGLAAAARGGHVALANSLGSGLAEGPLWLSLLPAAMRHLLGEEPKLPAQATAWQRAPAAGQLLRPAFSYRERPLAEGDQGWEAALADRAVRPHAWVVQDPLAPSTAPCWDEPGLPRRPQVLRLFALRHEHGWEVMPGGLTRSAGGSAWLEVAGACKDAWIQSRGPVPDISLLPSDGAAVELRRGGIDIPSRVADGLFWLGRYAERLEGGARLLRSALVRLADEPGGARAAVVPYLGFLTRAGLGIDDDGTPPERALAQGCARLGPAATGLARNAGAVRDRLSADTWRAIGAIERTMAAERHDAGDPAEAVERLDRLIMACAALAGMGQENTTRGPGWRFLDLGRRIERAAQGLDLLQAAADAGFERPALEAVLAVADSSITYRARYLATLQAHAAVDLILTDDTNPRSVGFQAEAIASHLAHLPHEQERALPTPAERIATRILAAIRLADPAALFARGADPDEVRTLLASLADDVTALAEALSTAYLIHVAPSRSLARGTP
ncbi:MAG: hypothetical protein RLZZ127_367 [Planctomycetota bacterium]|jgi:uncharacterized circularly permuted ATP-grasp superfamily protein/uncharacterized alpha-E superfamily protein